MAVREWQLLQDAHKKVEQGINRIKTIGTTFKEIQNAVIYMASGIAAISQNLNRIASKSSEMSIAREEIDPIS